MIAILLCAGYATRMYPMTRNFPKPLLPVAGKPVIDYLIEQILNFAGIKEIHIVSNDKFYHHYEDWSRGWLGMLREKHLDLHIHNDGSTTNENRLGPAADFNFVLKKIAPPERMLVSASDNIFRFALKPLWQAFLNSDGHFILALPETDKKKLRQTGVLELGKNNRVLRLHEKPNNPPSKWACPLIYFLQGSIPSRLSEFLASADKSHEQGHFIDFLCQREEVYAFKRYASRLSIGSIESYRHAEAKLKKERLFEEGFTPS